MSFNASKVSCSPELKQEESVNGEKNRMSGIPGCPKYNSEFV
jgi:hypothetical protein